ncbi:MULTISPECIES: hypothetical protein [unclassified Herbaspirillum]|uniref:hypothetical protein n=1 Tax=unclassified Herbaspirillum TaxID=2624150 RepID=UPI000E2E98F4|nr:MULTISPECIES: hypothetical protein [unclassified Herbaspirillum]RFB68596.1 hypothetical protein DZB54_15750 [Herbaspirillum sp. 3R-3a1]TFI05502.1 hypothetical protein E4P32_20425 [Herbaspirillum sp. 3R11]TFI13588.1 hypothetical protein E4P31_18170 [Herbaspirillum sp. 3R-11]TFI27106.1 hypothetical protein E4P30_10500 [Herbaspirillum sp. 3C11]
MSIEAKLYLAETERRRRELYRKRSFVLLGGVSAFLGALLFFYWQGSPFSYLITRYLGIGMLIVAFSIFGILYLQSGQVWLTEEGRREADTSFQNYEIDALKSQVGAIAQQLKDIESKIPSAEDLSIPGFDKDATIERIVRDMGAESVKSIFSAEAQALEQTLSRTLLSRYSSEAASQIVGRLMREIRDLRLRSNLNLLLGMGITAFGLYLLWVTVSIVDTSDVLKNLASDTAVANSTFFRNLTLPFVPRISLVIFIEIFAYFFLRLYRDGLAEIKYFQNELTNVQSKILAVEMAIGSGIKDALPASVAALSQTERNFILQKDQTTVELEKAKSDSELSRSILKVVPSLFKQKK